MTTQIPPSALAAALTETYWRRQRRGDRVRMFLRGLLTGSRRVLAAALVVSLQATLFLMSAVRHAGEGDLATAILLGVGFAGAALVAVGLYLGNRVAYVMTLAYTGVNALLMAVGEHRPAIGALVLLALLVNTGYFFRR